MDTDDLDFFLLEVVSDHWQPLWLFAWERSQWGFWIKSGHNVFFPRQELVAALQDLQASGDVQLLWDGSTGNPSRKGRPVRHLNAEELEAGVLRALPLSYELTPKGGERWARICEVDWGRWVDDSSHHPDSPSTAAITTGDPDCTTFWLEVALRWKNVIPESIRWEEVRPWRPVYWHEEAVGYRASYRIADENGERRVGMPPEPVTFAPEPAAPLAPRRVRGLPAATRPLRKWTDSQLEQRAEKGSGRRAFAAAMELAPRQQDTVKLRHWLSWSTPHRYAAARELGRRRDAGAVDDLLQAVFTHGDLASVEALGAIGDERCLAPLTMLFAHVGNSSAHLVATIGRTIAGFGEAGVTALLPYAGWVRGVQALRHTHSEQAVEAIQARLGKCWEHVDVLEAMGVLCPWRWPKRRFSAEQLHALERRAASADWRARYEVVWMLRESRMDPTGAEHLLERLAEDPDIVVRECARLWNS